MSLQNRRRSAPDRAGGGSLRRRNSAAPGSDVEAHVEDVAVLDHVVAALHAHPAAALGLGLAARLNQLVPLDHLGPDEPAGEVGVDLAGRLLGILAAAD